MKNYLVYPTKRLYISQSYNDSFSHYRSFQGVPADYPIDDSGGNASRNYFYCPCDEVVIKRIYGVGQSGTNAIWMESTSKVIMANNNECYVTIMVIHPNDDTLKNIKVGDKFKRGEAMFLEGNDGNATGYHFHISVSASRYVSGGWQINNKGAWVIKGTPIKPENAFFIDGDFTEFINSKGLKFKYLPKILGQTVLRDQTKQQIEVIVDELRVRKSPNGEIIGYINVGLYNVLDEKKDGNYTWYKIENDMWIASNERIWTIFYDIKVEPPIINDEQIDEKIVNNYENIWQKIKRFILNLFNK